MAGTIPSLSLAQFNDINGVPLSGAFLYIYEAGTTTPVTSYKNSALTTGSEHPWPIEANASGMIPQFWLDDGSYRVRFTDSAGVVIFDEDSFPALGASSGGGGSTTVVSSFETGDVVWQPKSGTWAGWVRHNGRTIGSAASGASERANADCQVLFETLWARHSDTICPVSGGRGASAAADWAANKTITLLDLRGRAPAGLDDMGNTSASRLSGVTFATGDATTAASVGGAATVTLTAGQMPSHTHTGTTDSNGAHTHTTTAPNTNNQATTAGWFSGDNTGSQAISTSSNGAHTHTFTTASSGSGEAHSNMQPFALGTWYARL